MKEWMAMESLPSYAYSPGTGTGNFALRVPATKPAKNLEIFRKWEKKKEFIDQTGFEPMTTVPPAQALVHLATLLAAAGCRFLPNLYTLPL